tara:strand:- start:648 stop:1742 length:1095 start_codon:yes stop_codon:yes gene_type:complete
MAIYGQDINFTSALQQRKANQEQEFYGSLLSNAMRAGGQFDVEDGNPIYTASPMQDKTESWNQFVQMKGGRISPADVQSFEAAWKQADAMKTQQQMQELGRLRLRGFDDNDIRDAVEDSPELYGSLMDMVSNLEMSGDENAMAQAAMVRQYLPTQSDTIGERFGEYAMENPGMTMLGAYGAYRGGQYALDKWGKGLTAKLMGDPEAMKAFDDYTKGKYVRKDGQWLYGDKHSKAGQKVTLPNAKAKLDRMYNASKSRSWKNMFSGNKFGGMGTYIGAAAAPEIGEMLGGEAGRELGRYGGAAAIGGAAAQKATGLLGRLGAFGAKAAARHAAAAGTGIGAHPIAQLGLLGADAFLLYQMLAGDE